MAIGADIMPSGANSPTARAFVDYIWQRHPSYNYRECLDVVIKIFERRTSRRNPRTGELARALGFANQKIIHLAEAMEPKYVQIDRANSRRFYVRIESTPYFTRDEQEREFSLILDELQTFIESVLQGIADENVRREANVLSSDVFRLKEQGDLYAAIKEYHELIKLLDAERVKHGLRDADQGRTAHQYRLTDEGEEVFYALQRGEFEADSTS